MMIEQSAAEAEVRIGPVLFFWMWSVVGTVFGLSLAAKAFAHGAPWVALPWLVLSCGNVVLPFLVRTLGVDLTSESALVHGRHRRTVPWREVQSVISHVKPNGTSEVRLMLENGEALPLPFPKTLWRRGDAQYERDFQRIDRWWLAHRGESWRPISPAAPQPPAQG